MKEWEIGVLITICGNLSINFGINLAKIGMNHIKNRRNGLGKTIKVLGWSLFLCGNVANFAGLCMAPQSLLGCLGSLQFISNLFFAGVFLKEKITIKNYLGTVAVVLGNLIIIIWSPLKESQRRYTTTELFMLYNKTPYKIYLASICIGYFLLSLFSSLGGNSALSCSQGGKKCQWIDGVVFSAMSAMLGTQSLILGKTMSYMLKLSFQGYIVFFRPFNAFNVLFAVCIAGFLAVSAYFWMWRMRMSLQLFETMFIIPLNQCMWILFSVVGGGIYFEEFNQMKFIGGLRLIYAMCFILMGVFLLCPSSLENRNSKNIPEKLPFMIDQEKFTNPIEITVHSSDPDVSKVKKCCSE